MGSAEASRETSEQVKARDGAFCFIGVALSSPFPSGASQTFRIFRSFQSLSLVLEGEPVPYHFITYQRSFQSLSLVLEGEPVPYHFITYQSLSLVLGACP